MGKSLDIPVVDLSPFLTDGNEEGKKKVLETIIQASSEFGVFQILNHGVPLDLMKRGLELSNTFFAYPDEEKLKYAPVPGSDLPAGYSVHPAGNNEMLFMTQPGMGINVYPSSLPEFQKVAEELFVQFAKTSRFMESILNKCLGLPSNFLQEYNHDRSWDILLGFRYRPATETTNEGLSEHQDANFITFILQDECGGLEIEKDGEWYPMVPVKDALTVNIGDMIQVLSNGRFKASNHRVKRPVERYRYSFVYFNNLLGDKWVEPLLQLTTKKGEPPKYRGFRYNDYYGKRMREELYPEEEIEHKIDISHYAIHT